MSSMTFFSLVKEKGGRNWPSWKTSLIYLNSLLFVTRNPTFHFISSLMKQMIFFDHEGF